MGRSAAAPARHELAEHAITHSGNLATNLLLDVVGVTRSPTSLRLAGCSATTVVGRGIEDAAARRAGITNTVTAADLGMLLGGRRETRVRAGRPGGLRAGRGDALAPTPPRSDPAGSTGRHRRRASRAGSGVSHDVALVRPVDEEPFVLAICTTIDLGEHEGAAFVASIAADVWAAGHVADRSADHADIREVRP